MEAACPFDFLTTAPPAATVTIDAGIRSKEELFAAMSSALEFSGARVRSWDELVDALVDASWQAGTEASIDHAALPALGASDLTTYLRCLADALQRRSSLECAGLRITFRRVDAPRVARLLEPRR